LTPFAPQLSAPLRAWRIDQARHSATWDSGIGSYGAGGRWNLKGSKAVYCSLDAATAILEVAVHKGFPALDATPHMITGLEIADPAQVHVVMPTDVPNPGWLVPGLPGVGQQAFGAALLAQHAFFAIPSAVSHHSWNLIFDPDGAKGLYKQVLQERLAIDTRLNPPIP
jgi:RES domain-containing protein